MTITRHGTTARYSDVVVHNDTLYTVEVPSTRNSDVATQTREILASLDALLARGGSSREHLLTATIYLTHMTDYDAMNVEWDRWIPAGSAPCRACVRVAGLADQGWRVEIAVTAAVA